MSKALAPVFVVILLAVIVVASPEVSVSQPDSAGRSSDTRARLSPERAERIIGRVQPGRTVRVAGWPQGKKVAVALTFDLDAELVWMDHPEETSPAALSRGRYGPRAGLGRVLNLLERKSVPATFFLPALIFTLHPEAVDAIQAFGRHEIGYHGYAHEEIRTLNESQEREAMQRGLELFKRAGLRPRVYRSPSWNFSPSTLNLLQELGFRFDSSLMADDRPYELLADTIATGIIELPVDWSLDDWPYFQLDWAMHLPGLRSPQEVLEIWREEFEGIRSEGGIFILTLHPQVIGRWSRIRMLERLIEHIDTGGDAWYATLGEIGDHLLRGR